MAVQQPTYRTGARSNALARRLNDTRCFASHLLDSTMQVEQFAGRAVIRCRARETMRVGDITILGGQAFYFIASKFTARFYVVKHNGFTGTWESSATDERVVVQHVEQVRQYIRQYHAQKQAA